LLKASKQRKNWGRKQLENDLRSWQEKKQFVEIYHSEKEIASQKRLEKLE